MGHPRRSRPAVVCIPAVVIAGDQDEDPHTLTATRWNILLLLRLLRLLLFWFSVSDFFFYSRSTLR